MPRSFIIFIVMSFIAAAASTAAVPQSTAQPPAAHDHTPPPLPTSYPAAVSAITSALDSINTNIALGKLEPAGDVAFNLNFIAKSLGKIALADTSVPRPQIKQINILGKSIADEALELHEAAESNKPDAAKSALAALRARVADLGALSGPDPYICSMHCEGAKTYDKSGTCPICKMELTPISKTPHSVTIDLPKGAPALAAGVPTALDIKITQPDGKPVGDLDTVHEYPLHLIIVSEDLSFYSHEHPARNAGGLFQLKAFTFPFGGRFTIYADFTPKGRANQVAQTDITVPAGAIAAHTPITLVENEDGVGKQGDYEFRIRCNAGKFFGGPGIDSFLRYGVDLKGQPVTDLEPLMGAMGHLVIVSADRSTYIHAHPLDLNAKPGDAHAGHDHAHAGHDEASLIEKARASTLTNTKPSDVVFHAIFPRPGLYRAFAQFQHKGKLLTYAVTIDAKKPEGASSTPDTTPPAHDHDKHK